MEIKERDVREVASEDMAKTLLESLIMLIRTQKKPWAKLTIAEQDEVIDALRKSVRTATTSAVRLIASNSSMTVVGDLEQVTIKDGVKIQIVASKNAENLTELFDAVGSEVLVVCSSNPVYDKDLDKVQGEDDQRSLDLGKEYTDEDGAGMDNQSEQSDVIDLPEAKQIGRTNNPMLGHDA